MLHYAGVQLKYDSQELARKTKLSSSKIRDMKNEQARAEGLVSSTRSRQLVPGQAVDKNEFQIAG